MFQLITLLQWFWNSSPRTTGGPWLGSGWSVKFIMEKSVFVTFHYFEMPSFVCIYIWGLRARQHLRSLSPVMNDDDDNDGQMIFGDLGCLNLPDICLTGEEKPRKNLTQETSRPGIEPGPSARQALVLPPGPQRWTRYLVLKYRVLK